MNLDRESEREDIEPHIWQEFLRRLASRNPTAADPLTPLQNSGRRGSRVVHPTGKTLDGARFFVDTCDTLILNGCSRAVLRHCRGIGDRWIGAGERPSRKARPSGLVLGRDLCGGHGSYRIIACDLWPKAESHIVEIAYTHEILMPDNYVRVAAVRTSIGRIPST
jgi:hypothetical protein